MRSISQFDKARRRHDSQKSIYYHYSLVHNNIIFRRIKLNNKTLYGFCSCLKLVIFVYMYASTSRTFYTYINILKIVYNTDDNTYNFKAMRKCIRDFYER